MEIVENKTYYHISRSNYFNIGDELFIGKRINDFNSYFDSWGANYQSQIIANEFINPIIISNAMIDYLQTGDKDAEFAKVFSYDAIDAITSLKRTIEHYQKFTREHIFEEIRKDFFPNYPSRQRCLWVIPDNHKAVIRWWDILGCKGTICELSVSGKIHQANQRYLNLTANSLDFIRQQAFKYWSNAKIEDNQDDDECLFEGFIKVVSVKDISEFNI